MRQLHDRYGGRVQFVDIVARQAHPGERHGPYRSFEQKLADGTAYQQEESVSWPVAVDDLEGSTQRAYGGMSASIYLLDANGRVVYYGMWGQAPPLTAALDRLLNESSNATEKRLVDRIPHLGAAIVAGQRGPLRGGLQSLFDLELGFPGAVVLMTLGWLLRPVLKPLVQRTTPIPKQTRIAVLCSAFLAAVAAISTRSRRSRRSR
jgi:hypothetical protein